MSPNDREYFDKGLENEQEWRREIWKIVKSLEKRLDSQAIKVYTMSGGMAIITTIIVLIMSKFLVK